MKVFNVPRSEAKRFKTPVDKEKFCWVSISEPNEQNTIVSNVILDSLENLKLAFFDLKEEIPYRGKIIKPATDGQIRRILNFLLKNKAKSIIINCAAGISRSGAICKFCEEYLGYDWPEEYKECSLPNNYIFGKLVEFYEKT